MVHSNNVSKLNQIKRIILFLFISFILILPCNGSDTQFFNIPIHQFIITNVSQYEFYPGEVFVIDITIKNIRENSVFEVTSNIASAEPFKIKKELSKYRQGELFPNQEYTVQYEIYVEEDTLKGVYNLPLSVLWTTVEGGVVQKQEDLNIGIYVFKNPEDIKIDITDIIVPEEIFAGENFSLNINLKNEGKTNLNDLRVNLPLEYPFAVIDTDSEKFITSIKPNETVEITYNIQVDSKAESKLYYSNLTLSYRNPSNLLISKTSILGLNINDASLAYIQEIIIEPAILRPETEGLLMIQIINTGTSTIENVKVIIYGGDEFLAQTHSFIGKIDPGESETTSFGIYVDPEARVGKYGLNIYTTYYVENKEKSFSNIYFTNVLPSDSLFLILEEVYPVVFGILAFSILSYLIFWITGSRIDRLKDEKKR